MDEFDYTDYFSDGAAAVGTVTPVDTSTSPNSSSFWSGLLETGSKLATAGANVYSAVTAPTKPTTTTPKTSSTALTGNSTVWIIGGAVAVVLGLALLLLVGRR